MTMKPIDFLKAVAAVMPGRPSPARTGAMAQFAVKVAAEFRGAAMSHHVADRVARRIGESFPTWNELCEAIRDCLPIEEQRGARIADRPLIARDEEAEDRMWWQERIAGWQELPPGIELAHLEGAHLVLTGRMPIQKGRHHPRPEIVAAVVDRINLLRDEGIQPANLRIYGLGGGGGRQGVRHVEVPHGPTVTTRPVIDQPVVKRDGHLSGETLEAQRAAAGIITRRAAE
jgi:hypothetical protein